VSGAGDVNGDGFGDPDHRRIRRRSERQFFRGELCGLWQSHRFYVKPDLAALDGSNGFKLSGGATEDRFGRPVVRAGDVNGDGFDDVILGALARRASVPARATWFLSSGFSANLELAALGREQRLQAERSRQ
jgi:hypothetical protein